MWEQALSASAQHSIEKLAAAKTIELARQKIGTCAACSRPPRSPQVHCRGRGFPLFAHKLHSASPLTTTPLCLLRALTHSLAPRRRVVCGRRLWAHHARRERNHQRGAQAHRGIQECTPLFTLSALLASAFAIPAISCTLSAHTPSEQIHHHTCRSFYSPRLAVPRAPCACVGHALGCEGRLVTRASEHVCGAGAENRI